MLAGIASRLVKDKYLQVYKRSLTNPKQNELKVITSKCIIVKLMEVKVEKMLEGS